MKRFYYFGCSYTSWATPTWGDIIAIDLINHHGFDYAVNRGRPGACNKFILSELNYVLDTENITNQDQFGVLWAAIHRDSFLGESQDDPNQLTWCTSGSVWQSSCWKPIVNHELVHCDYEMVYQTLLSRSIFHKLVKPRYEYRSAHVVTYKNESDDGITQDSVILDKKVLSEHYAGLSDLIDDQFEDFSNIMLLPRMIKKDHWPFSDAENPDHYNFYPDWWHSKWQDSHPDVYSHLQLAKQQHNLHPDTEKLAWHYHKMIADWMRKVAEYKPDSAEEWYQIYLDIRGDFCWHEERKQYGIRNGWIE